MENYVKRLEGVYRNIQSGGFFEEAGTIDGGAKGSYNPTIPAGFKAVNDGASWGDGTKAPSKDEVNKGLVIEDKEGNQFVWVPCSTDGKDPNTKESVTKYENHNYTGEDKSDAGTVKTDSAGWKTYYYRNYNDWTDTAAESYGNTSVDTYGGFYVARFEAGIPETASFYNEAVKTAYKPQYNKNAFTSGTDGSIRNVGDIAPVSKKNTPSWSWISQEKASEAAKLMVDGKSHLIDGTAWDTIVNWINDKAKTMDDSSSVGNYYSSTGTIPAGTMYIKHTYDGGWITGANYQKADSDINQPKGTGTNYYEVYTGSLDNTKLKNIYDMAGNMWEWTTETGKHNVDGSSFAVRRGGGFYSNAPFAPLCDRSGVDPVTHTFFYVGFRVVLYL